MLQLSFAADSQPQLRHLVLNFPLEKPVQAKELALLGGSFGTESIVYFSSGQGTTGHLAVALEPGTELIQESQFNAELSRFPGSLYYGASGLRRRFVYRLPIDSAATKLPVPSSYRERLRLVGVNLPLSADVLEPQPGTVRTMTPFRDTLLAHSRLRVYPVRNDSQVAPAINVIYQVPASVGQTLIIEYLVKVFGLVVVPLLQVAAIARTKRSRPSARRWIIGIGLVIELAIVGALLWYSFRYDQADGLKRIVDVVLAALGAAAGLLAPAMTKDN